MMIGWPRRRPMSLAEATSEPVKVTEPIRTSATMNRTSQPSRLASPPSGVRSLAWRTRSSTASSAAAPPPTALKSETSCGMAVMATVRAMRRPAYPPTARPPRMMPQLSRLGLPLATQMSSAVTAVIMPAAERRLPLRAVAGEFIKCRPTAKRAAPARKASCTRCSRSVAFMPAPRYLGDSSATGAGRRLNICSIRSVTQ